MAQGDFNSFVTFMSAEVDHKNKRKAQLGNKTRNISALNQNGGSRGNGNGKSKNRNQANSQNLGPMLSAMVDGKKVEGKIYPKKEFSNLTRAQRDKVIELYRKRKNSSGSNISTTDLNSLSSRISSAVIAGVRQASMSNLEEESITIDPGSVQVPNNTSNSGSSTNSGAVGDYMSKRRRGNNGSRTE